MGFGRTLESTTTNAKNVELRGGAIVRGAGCEKSLEKNGI